MSKSQRIFLLRHVPQAGTLCDRYGRPARAGLDVEEGIEVPSIVLGTRSEVCGTARRMSSFFVEPEDEGEVMKSPCHLVGRSVYLGNEKSDREMPNKEALGPCIP